MTYKNSLRLCFFKYFLVKYLRYLFDKAISAMTLIFLSSLATLTLSPSFPTLPWTLILCLRNSAKLAVLKTLSSTGFEQSMLKACETFFYCATFLLMAIIDFMMIQILINLFVLNHKYCSNYYYPALNNQITINSQHSQHITIFQSPILFKFHKLLQICHKFIILDKLSILFLSFLALLYVNIQSKVIQIQNLQQFIPNLYMTSTSTQPNNFNQPQSLVKYSNPVLVSSSGKKQTKDKINPQNLSNTYTEDILNSILPPRQYTTEKQQLWIQSVSATPATKQDVLDLQQKLDKRLQQRQARQTGICPIRQELYSQCFDELIRQITINCAQRGLLLVRVRDQIRSTIQSYQTLYESSIAFGMRRALQAQQKKKDMETKINTLRNTTKELEDQVNDLEEKLNEMERKDKEQQDEDKQTHKNNVEAQKRTNQILKEELQKLLQGPQPVKK